MLKILLVGSGAREHAIARALKKSKHEHDLVCFASNENPGIVSLSQHYTVGSFNDIDAIQQFAVQYEVDFAIIGPELPLSLGVVDFLQDKGIDCIGSAEQLAQIETSKGFARDLLARYQIPASPLYKTFNSLNGTAEFLKTLGDEYVIKADGLMGGKGVKLSKEHLFDHKAALFYCDDLLSNKQSFVIEEKLLGAEFSLMSFSDGKNLAHMPVVQDHKRVFVDDKGVNTGGMGSYSSANHELPFLDENDIKKAQQINQAVIEALYKEFGILYKGILYGGFILTKSGVKLIEYNARFGDPEAINVLALLETDFIDICQAIISESLNQTEVKFAKKATVCKYLVPQNYPDAPCVGQEIDVSQVNSHENLYYAAVNAKKNSQTGEHKVYTTGSRSLAVLGVADSIAEAEEEAEVIAQQVQGTLYHRKDIGTAELINKRINQVNHICSKDYKLL